METVISTEAAHGHYREQRSGEICFSTSTIRQPTPALVFAFLVVIRKGEPASVFLSSPPQQTACPIHPESANRGPRRVPHPSRSHREGWDVNRSRQPLSRCRVPHPPRLCGGRECKPSPSHTEPLNLSLLPGRAGLSAPRLPRPRSGLPLCRRHERSPKGEATDLIAFVLCLYFVSAFLAQKSHVKPLDRLNHTNKTRSTWQVSYRQPAIMNI